MIKRFSDLPVERKLFITALLLGFIAIFGANPYEHTFTSVNTKEIAFAAGSKTTRIDPLDLAGWIIEGRADYKLADVRSSEKEFNEYHIPGAENLSLMDLQAPSFERTEKIVLYSGNEMEAAQAWFLLRSKGYKAVYILSGGLNEWKNRVLFPVVTSSTNAEEAMKAEKIKEVSKFFGGAPRVSGEDKGAQMNQGPQMTQAEMPKLQAPLQQNGGNTTAPRKKKEGC